MKTKLKEHVNTLIYFTKWFYLINDLIPNRIHSFHNNLANLCAMITFPNSINKIKAFIH